ncbi:putative membrane protein [Exiguobacterium sp. S17]|nr:putative membrane protein [Exiguobacterium sp. S17]
MNHQKQNLPFLMRSVPFFLMAALCGPLALILVVIYWRDSSDEVRGPYLIFAVIFSLFFIVKLLPDGLLQIILFSFTYTFVWFLTYSILKRKRDKRT